jgi:hypothetical protein
MSRTESTGAHEMTRREAEHVIAEEILKRIARRYENCNLNIYPDMPVLTPVEAVLRCAAEEGFALVQREPVAALKPSEGQPLPVSEVREAMDDKLMYPAAVPSEGGKEPPATGLRELLTEVQAWFLDGGWSGDSKTIEKRNNLVRRITQVLNTPSLEPSAEKQELEEKSEIISKCFAVVYSNYFPSEIDSLWRTQAEAEMRCKELDGPWNAVEMKIQGVAGSTRQAPEEGK